MEEAQRRVDDWIEQDNPGRDLYISHLGLTALPDLPSSLKALYCSNNQLQTLPALPSSLEVLACQNNQLQTLPALPSSLEVLTCRDNQLQTLPALPSSLEVLACQNNQLRTLPALPSSLELLYCSNNQLRTLPAFPRSFETLVCRGNPLPFFLLADWKRLSDIRRSIHLRAFQRRHRKRLIRKRTRPKDLLNYSIYGRPGLGVGWFEMCAEVGHDPRRYDRKKYGLRGINV